MAHSVKDHIRIEVAEYDDAIRRFIPGYEEMLHGAALAVVQAYPSHVLDLGAGTAALSEQVLIRTNNTIVELWDIDPLMLEQAATRLARFEDRVVRRIQSYDDSFPPCDAIMASLSLHHIPSLQEKERLFARAYEALSPAGIFVSADATMPTDERQKRARYRAWIDHMKAGGITEARAWQHLEEWSDEDTYMPETDEVEALERVGFHVTVPWRGTISTVVVASKQRH